MALLCCVAEVILPKAPPECSLSCCLSNSVLQEDTAFCILFPRWSVLQTDSVISVAHGAHDRKALRTSQHCKELFQQSDLAHVPHWSHPSLAATQSGCWHHSKVLPALLSTTSLSPSFTTLPAFFSLGPLFASLRQEKAAHTPCFPARWDGRGQPGVSSSQRATLKEWVDWSQAKCTVPPVSGLDFHSAK